MARDRRWFGLSPLEVRVMAAIIETGHASRREIRDRLQSQSSRFTSIVNYSVSLNRLIDSGYVASAFIESVDRFYATNKGLRAMDKAAKYYAFHAAITHDALRKFHDWTVRSR